MPRFDADLSPVTVTDGYHDVGIAVCGDHFRTAELAPIRDDGNTTARRAGGCVKQVVVGHVPGHTESVWMIECSTRSDGRPPPSGGG
jgi:hypothetical protein